MMPSVATINRMTWILGVDEAGYGPNLGPLTIGATLWRDDAAKGNTEVDLYDRLAGAVTKKPTPGRIAVADSKQLYKPAVGLRPGTCCVQKALSACIDSSRSNLAVIEAQAVGKNDSPFVRKTNSICPNW